FGLQWADRLLPTPIFEGLSLNAYDAALGPSRQRWERQGADVDPRVVLIQITERTYQELHGPPLAHATHAQLIRQLKRLGARVIAFDMYFPDEQPTTPELVAAMKEHGRVLVSSVRQWERLHKDMSWQRQIKESLPDIRDVATSGWSNLPKDLDGVL